MKHPNKNLFSMKHPPLLFSVEPPFPTLRVRLFATILDTLIVLFLAQLAAKGYFGKFLHETSPTLRILVVGGVYTMSAYWMVSSTYAKVILGMRIVDETGRKMSLKQSCIRAIVMVAGAIPVFLGYFYATTNLKRQSFHDKVAKTLVVFDES